MIGGHLHQVKKMGWVFYDFFDSYQVCIDIRVERCVEFLHQIYSPQC